MMFLLLLIPVTVLFLLLLNNFIFFAMNYNSYVLDVGRTFSCAPALKFFAPAVGAAIVGAGASVLGNLFGSANNSNANNTNIRLAAENRDFQREMWDKQVAYNQDMWNQQVAHNQDMFNQQVLYNKDMWNAQNAYNDPSAQVARLRAAGINPYLAMSGGNAAGVAGSAGSVSPGSASPGSVGLPAGDTAHVNPYIPDSRGFVDAALNLSNQFYQARKLDSEVAINEATAEGLNIQNQYAGKIAESTLLDFADKHKSFFEQYRGAKWQNDLNDFSTPFRKRMIENDTISSNQRLTNMDLVNYGLELQNKLSSVNLKWLDMEKAAGLTYTYALYRKAQADTYAAQKAGDLSDEQVHTQRQMQNHIYQQTVGQMLSNVGEDARNQFLEYTLDTKPNRHIQKFFNYVGAYTGALGNLFSGVGSMGGLLKILK